MTESPLQEFLADVWYVLLWLMLTAHLVSHAVGLGVGITAGFRQARTKETRVKLRVVPVDTAWLVLFACGLAAAFPRAFVLLLESTGLPIAALLIALAARAFALSRDVKHAGQFRWRATVASASAMAAVAQGWIFGAVLYGLTASGQAPLAAPFGWFSLYSTAVAGSTLLGYTLVGAAYVLHGRHAQVAEHARRVASRTGALSLLLAPMLILWSNAGPLRGYANGWWTAVGVLGVAGILTMLLRQLRPAAHGSPLSWAIGYVVFAALLAAIEIYPYLLPHAITVFEAAASNQRLVLLTVAFGLLIPSLLAYNVYRYVASENEPRD